MKLKNYTSEAPVGRSVSKIEAFLAEIGANQILKEYEGGALVGMSFQIPNNGLMLPIKLPARVEKVKKVLWKEIKRATSATKERIDRQAERTAWKTVYEWIVIQCQMIRLDQADLAEVFLPYIWSPAKQKTFYQVAQGGEFLPAPTKKARQPTNETA